MKSATAECHLLASEPHMPLNVRPRMQHRLHIRPARTQTRPSPSTRNRVLYAGLVLAVIAGGLLWRSSFMPVPPAVAKYGGDALWALMVFVGFGFLIPRAPTIVLSLLALSCSWGSSSHSFTTSRGSMPCVPRCQDG